MMPEHDNGKWIKITQLLLTVIAVTAVPWCVWATARIHHIELGVRELETFAAVGGRFTQENARTLRLELMSLHAAELATVWKELNTLNTQVATLPQTLTIPPKWWEEFVRTELNRLDRRISTLEAAKPN